MTVKVLGFGRKIRTRVGVHTSTLWGSLTNMSAQVTSGFDCRHLRSISNALMRGVDINAWVIVRGIMRPVPISSTDTRCQLLQQRPFIQVRVPHLKCNYKQIERAQYNTNLDHVNEYFIKCTYLIDLAAEY